MNFPKNRDAEAIFHRVLQFQPPSWLSLNIALTYLCYYTHCPIKLTLTDKQPSNESCLQEKCKLGIPIETTGFPVEFFAS